MKDKHNALLMLTVILGLWSAYLIGTEQPFTIPLRVEQLVQFEQLGFASLLPILILLFLAGCALPIAVALTVRSDRGSESFQKSFLSAVLLSGVFIWLFYGPSLREAAPDQASIATGIRKDYWPNGHLKSEEPFVNGLHQGLAHYYWDNGKPYGTFRWLDDKYHGVRVLFRPDGSVEQQVADRHGLHHGELQWFARDGSLDTIERWYEDWRSSERQFAKIGVRTLPYGKVLGLMNVPKAVKEEFIGTINTAAVSNEGCATVTSADLQGEYQDLRSNVCDEAARAKLGATLLQVAPFLHKEQLAFYKDDLDGDANPDLLIAHVGRTEPNRAPAMALYFVTAKEGDLQVHFKGPYPNGRWLKAMPFRPVPQSKTLFVKYSECERPCDRSSWQLEAINFRLSESGMTFLFRGKSSGYGEDSLSEFVSYNESLREEPYTATLVELRVSPQGAAPSKKQWVTSLIQRTVEWEQNLSTRQMEATGLHRWAFFRCSDYQCASDMKLGEVAPQFKLAWEEGAPLVTAGLAAAGLTETVGKRPSPNSGNGLRKEVYPDSRVKSEEPFVAGVRHGLARYWWPDGKLYGLVRWAKGQMDSTRVLFRQDGSIRHHVSFRKGIRDGVEQWFNPNGTLNLVTFHDGGEVMHSKEYERPAQRVMSNVFMKSYDSDLPPYGQLFSLLGASPEIRKQFAGAVKKAAVSSKGCADPVSNVCHESDRTRLTALLAAHAPFLKEIKMVTFYKGDLNSDGVSELLVGVEAPGRPPDNYFAFYVFQLKGDQLEMHLRGPYLEGKWHSITGFGHESKGKTLLVSYLSCTECEPTTLLEPINFEMSESGSPFFFDYSPMEGSRAAPHWFPRIEYAYTPEGDSGSTEIETRIAQSGKSQLVDLIQKSEDYDNAGKMTGSRWWIFSCHGRRCSAKVVKGDLPAEYKKTWERARKL